MTLCSSEKKRRFPLKSCSICLFEFNWIPKQRLSRLGLSLQQNSTRIKTRSQVLRPIYSTNEFSLIEIIKFVSHWIETLFFHRCVRTAVRKSRRRAFDSPFCPGGEKHFVLSFYFRPMASPILVDRMREIKQKDKFNIREKRLRNRISQWIWNLRYFHRSIDQSSMRIEKHFLGQIQSSLFHLKTVANQILLSWRKKSSTINFCIYLNESIGEDSTKTSQDSLSFHRKEWQNENIFHYPSSFIQGDIRKVFSSILTEDISIAVSIYYSQTPLHLGSMHFLPFEKTNHRNSSH